ncbi:Zinc metalloproteinase nas-4, partial [Stegodyphus mimosarum]
MAVSAAHVLWLFSAVICVSSSPLEDASDKGPEYLDMLLSTGQYEEFSKELQIDNVDLVRPAEGERSIDPMFNKGLELGDILLTRKQMEQARQGIRFDKYGGNKWSGRQIPFAISNSYESTYRAAINEAINVWNSQVSCLKFVPWRWWQRDYVFFFNGNGCYSNLGKVGGKQSISLSTRGCFRQGTILHEMIHASGTTHEQNRSDRDEYIKVLFENIPEEWRSQYEKTNPADFGLQGSYDYYSVMHYPMQAPGTNKPAFQILKPGIDESRIGQREGFTQIDL